MRRILSLTLNFESYDFDLSHQFQKPQPFTQRLKSKQTFELFVFLESSYRFVFNKNFQNKTKQENHARIDKDSLIFAIRDKKRIEFKLI